MSRAVKYFSLHRIATTELRVVSNVEDKALQLTQIEEEVIGAYTSRAQWPHRWVMFFILEDLQPLVNQLRLGASPDSLGRAGYALDPGSAAVLNARPVVNIYDTADLSGCNVYVNQQALKAEGYWDDPMALKGLLAHEHAHPLAENETTRSSRQLRLQVVIHGTNHKPLEGHRSQVDQVLAGLSEKLCLLSPREIFTNEMAIRSGFDEALLHLNLRNEEHAAQSIAGRQQLVEQLQQKVEQGKLAQADAEQLLLIGDLNAHLPLAVEIAPFYRAGRDSDARKLEGFLETDVFPKLDPSACHAFDALKNAYTALKPGLNPADLLAWSVEILTILSQLLAEKGLDLQVRLWVEPDNKK